ncbi:MAG: hypothetical protein IJY47_08035 [Clostridia bacterium]|nr:hypothetical protein [Clostridia bacterium]
MSSLRFYHVSRDGSDIYLFSNDAIRENVDAAITLPHSGDCLIYEPWDNRLYRGEVKDGVFHLRLEKGNMLFLLFGGEIPTELPLLSHEVRRIPLPLSFEIAVREEEDDEFRVIATDSEPFDISAPNHFPHFSGNIRYRAEFAAQDGYSVLDLGDVGEVAEVWLNGYYLGARIGAPYKFDMSPSLQSENNRLEIVVKSNLAHRRRDRLSGFIQIPPSGITGEFSLCRYEP